MSQLAVTGYAWLLSLHVLAAFAVGAPVTLLVLVAVAGRRAQTPAQRAALDRVARPAAILFRVGVTATLVFGVWLVARERQLLHPRRLDHRRIRALAGDRRARRSGHRRAEARGRTKRRTGLPMLPDEGAEQPPSVLWLELGAAAATVAALALMIWKPGA